MVNDSKGMGALKCSLSTNLWQNIIIFSKEIDLVQVLALQTVPLHISGEIVILISAYLAMPRKGWTIIFRFK